MHKYNTTVAVKHGNHVIDIIIKILCYLFVVGFMSSNSNSNLLLPLESTTLMVFHFHATNDMTFDNHTISSAAFQISTTTQ